MSTRALRRLLAHLRDEGRCVLFSTHIMQEVEQLCDEIVVIAHGRSVAHGTVGELRALAGTASLEDAFVALALESDRVESDCGSRITDGASSAQRVSTDVAASPPATRDGTASLESTPSATRHPSSE
jgi:sodium transport system ATP-binding protein